MPTLLSLSPWNNGPASIACAALAFSVSTALVRPISREISVFELVFVRSLLSILLSVAIAASQQQPQQQRDHLALFGSPENRTLLMTRGLSGGLAMTVYYLSIQRLLLAEAMSLLFLNPAIVALLGYAVLGERLNRRQVGGIFTSLAGMLFVVRPAVHEPWSVDFDRASGVAFGVMSAFLASTAYVSIRKIGKKEEALTIAAYFHSISLVTSIVGMGLFARPVVPGLVDTAYMVSIASCSFLAQLLISRGFQLTSVAVGSAVNYAQVVFGAVFGWTFFSEPLSVVSVLGIILIFAGILAISIETQDNNNNNKNGRTDESAEMALLLPTLSTKASGDPTTASTTTR